MHQAITRHAAVRRSERIALAAIAVVQFSLALPLAACSGTHKDAEGRRLPSDDQVIQDVMPNDTQNVIAVETTPGKSGEAYLHTNDLAWYFDRGITVRRKANVDGASDAVLVVGGLARYVWTGDRYEYHKFLPTYNEYENIPAPDSDELVEYVKSNLREVFVSRDHTIVGISSVKLEDQPWQWHSATSFTAPFRIRYDHINSNTTTEAREDIFDIRFYRDAVVNPIKGLSATERSREILGQRQHEATEIQSMQTLRSGLR